MKKWLKILLIVLGVLILVTIIWLIATQKEKYFNTIVIENNNIFNTIKEKPYLDTIVYAGIKSLEINNLIIVINQLTSDVKNSFSKGDIELKAHIRGENNSYIIWTDVNMNRSEYIKTFSHELIHLKQYYTKELIFKDNIPIWKGKKFNLENINYQDRPWEKEAYSNQYELESKMNNILYN